MRDYTLFDHGNTERIHILTPRYEKYEIVQIQERMAIAGVGKVSYYFSIVHDMRALSSMIDLWYSLSDNFRKIGKLEIFESYLSKDDLKKIQKWCYRFGLVFDDSLKAFPTPESIQIDSFVLDMLMSEQKSGESLTSEEAKEKYKYSWFYIYRFRKKLFEVVDCAELLAKVLGDDNMRNSYKYTSKQDCYKKLQYYINRIRLTPRIELKGQKDQYGIVGKADRLHYHADDIFQAAACQCALLAVAGGTGKVLKRCENCNDLFLASRPNKKRCDKPECDRRAVSRRKHNEMKARERGGEHSAEES